MTAIVVGAMVVLFAGAMLALIAWARIGRRYDRLLDRYRDLRDAIDDITVGSVENGAYRLESRDLDSRIAAETTLANMAEVRKTAGLPPLEVTVEQMLSGDLAIPREVSRG